MQYILLVLSLVGLIFGLYFAFTCAGGLLLRHKAARIACPPTRRIAAVIAARNEEAVVGQLVSSLLAQKYPRDLFDVFVVPNNCSDRTEAVARKAGAQIIPCSGVISSKGDALRCAFDYLTALDQPYDAYCIFDADNLVDPLFFQAVNDARNAGFHVAQGYRDSKNPYDNWVSGSMSVFYWFMSRFYNTSRSALGMSAALNGTGFMVSDELIRKMGWETVTLTEDLEFSALCALEDVKIGWMPDARIYDEQPNTFRDSVIQRRRWSAGSLQCFKRYGPKLFARGTSASLDMAMLFTGMLLNLVGALSFILSAWLLISQIIAAPEHAGIILLTTLAGVLISSLFMSLACMAVFMLEKKLTVRCIPAILLFGLFMLTWMPINIICFFTRPPKWDAIRHTASHSASV